MHLCAALNLLAFVLAVQPTAAQENSPCRIKGNITKNGKLYFTPDHPDYGRVKISKKLKWFCSEQDAVASGCEKAGVMRSGGCQADPADEIPAADAPDPACVIKGNSTRIYHLPGGRCYSETLIHKTKKGDRWFCTEAEAQAAGYRRSKI